jgi:osmotically-inducible protein OsmY
MSDSLLIGAVRQVLGESADIDVCEVRVDVKGGVVYLTGTVNTLNEKRIADSLVRDIEGVKAVENDLVIVPSRLELDDLSIKESIEQALGNYPEETPTRIGVREVCDGIVYLAGKADSEQEVCEVMEIASRVPGVKEVVVEIDVAPGVPMDDIMIKNLVMDSLTDRHTDPFAIEVNVEDANVYLEGEVEDEEAKQSAEELASATTGVKNVINHLGTRRP